METNLDNKQSNHPNRLGGGPGVVSFGEECMIKTLRHVFAADLYIYSSNIFLIFPNTPSMYIKVKMIIKGK